jgi:DNA 3'-phosphatase
MNWYKHSTLEYRGFNQTLGEISNQTLPFAIFDIDSTLITRSNGKPNYYSDSDPSNWIWLGPVPLVLNIYKQQGWIICWYTNQSKYNEQTKTKFEQMGNYILQTYGWEPYIFVATGSSDLYRKPNPGFVTHFGFKFSPQSFMCGDGVGPLDQYVPYRWDSVDLLFASNLGIGFFRPIDLFGSNYSSTELVHEIKTSGYQVVILVGNQGSGKSSWAKTNSKYPSSFDELKTDSSMYGMAGQAILASPPELVIFDATNGTKAKRAKWIGWAKSNGLTWCIVWFIRDGRPWNKLRPKPIPEIAYNVYSKNFETPDDSEGPVYKIY